MNQTAGVLLTAPPGSGKSTAIQKIVARLGRDRCGGFWSEEVLEPGGARRGFSVEAIDTGERALMADVRLDSPFRVEAYGVDAEAIDRVAAASVRRAIGDKPFILIDEIGPMQLHSAALCEAVTAAVESGKALIGTVMLRSHPFADGLKRDRRLSILGLTGENRDALPLEIAEAALEGGGFQHLEYAEKIALSQRYGAERDRITLGTMAATMQAAHDLRQITYRDGRWQCSCDYFYKTGTCSHLMALCRLLSQSFCNIEGQRSPEE